MKKRLLSLVLTLALCLSVLPLTASAAGFTKTRTYKEGTFTDLPKKYYYDAVVDCYELGILSGTSDTKFSPNSMYTLRDALTVAARMHSISHGGTGVLPASNPWYQSAIDYCVQNGLMTRDEFGTSYKRNVTRAEMATLLVRALPADSWTTKNNVTALPDVSSATQYYNNIFTLYRAGILQGSDNFGVFNPDSNITRADVAVMIQRCVLPEKRLTFTLTPLSQRDAPEIIGKLSNYYWKVSNGLMCYQDSTNNLYGYVAANTGKVAIAAQYNDAENFVNGFAMVKKNGKWGIINTKGAVTLPISYNYVDSLGWGIYTARIDYSGRRCVAVNGAKVTDFVYSRVTTNGVYIFGQIGDNNWDVLDMDGKKIMNLNGKGTPYLPPKGTPLFTVKDGNKWALYTETGPATEFIYDEINLYEYCTLATGKYGNQYAILGMNGQVEGLGFGEFNTSRWYFNGDYVLVEIPEKGWAIADANGIRSEYFSGLGWGARFSIWGDVLVASSYESARFIYDMSTGKSQTAEGDVERGYVLAADGSFIVADGTKCEIVSDLGSNYYSFLTKDGKYGLLHNGNFASEGIYATEQEAINAYNYMKSTKENGKPVILVGNDLKGWDTGMGIRYYKNQMYYDEIKNLGEGYYACRFNTTWYLLHA